MVSYTLLHADGSIEKFKAGELTQVVVYVWTTKAIKENPWPFQKQPKVGEVYTIWWACSKNAAVGLSECRATLASHAGQGPGASWQQYLKAEIRDVEVKGRTRTIKMF